MSGQPERHAALVPDALLPLVAQRFKVLGDTNRLLILRLLVDRGPMNVGDIVAALGMSQANVSKHLRLMLDAGLVSRRAEGTSAYYGVVDPSVEQVCALVCDRIETQVEAQARALRRS
jgi:DNA-binding transcriptional ArsR family regulator